MQYDCGYDCLKYFGECYKIVLIDANSPTKLHIGHSLLTKQTTLMITIQTLTERFVNITHIAVSTSNNKAAKANSTNYVT